MESLEVEKQYWENFWFDSQNISIHTVDEKPQLPNINYVEDRGKETDIKSKSRSEKCILVCNSRYLCERWKYF